MQNFPNSPVPYHSGIGRSGAVIGSSYLPHHADLQMSPRNSEDFVTLQAQSLQNHGLHMRSHLHPSTVHSYGSRRASGEMAQGCANARDMGNPYRKETLDYYFTSAGQDRNRRVGASYGAGFRYVDGHAPQQFQHLPGPVPASRGMSPYSVDYSTAVGSGNGGASSFSPSQQFNVTHSPSAQSGAQIQRQLIQKYPTHQALHQSQVSQGFSLSGSRMTPQFGHYSPVNAATCSSGMYLSPPQRYDTSNTDAMSNSPTPTNLQNNTSVNRCEGSASSYSSTANPTKSPQSQSMHKPATLSQSWSAAAFESSVKGQLHGSTKPPSINSVSSPTLPLQSSQDINKSPMQSQIQSAQQNFSPISNSSPVPSATQSPSCSSSSSPGMGSLEAHSTTSHLPPSRSTLAPNAHSSQSQGHLQAISQLSPTPNSNSSISSCSSLGTNASSFNHSTSIAHSTIGQTRKRLGIQACLRDDTVLYSHEKLLQDTGLNSLNALTSQVENLPNTVQHTVLTDYLLSQKKSRDSAQQLLHQTVSGCQNRPEGSSCLSSANEERIEQKPSSDQQKEPKNKTRCTSNESEILNDPPSQNQTEQVNSHLNLFVASSETKTIDSRSPPSSLSSYSKPPATPFPIHSNCVPDQDFKVAHPERSKRRVTKVTTDEGGEVSRDPTLNRGSENTAASAEKHRSPLSPSEVDAFHHNNPSQIISKPEPQGVGVIVAACSEPSNKLSKHGDVKSTLFTVSHHLNSKTETKNYNGKGENCIEDFSPFAPISPKAKLVEKCPSSQPQPASVKYSKSELQFNSCASKGISGPRSGLCTNRFQNYPSMQATRNETFAEEISRSAVPRSENSSSQFQQSFPSLLQEVLQGHHLERHYLRSDQTSSAHNSHDMLHVCQQPRLGLLDSLNSQEVLSQTVLSGPNIHINQTGSSKPPNLKQIQCLGNEIISNSQHFWESEAYKPSVTHGDSLEKRKTSLSSRQTVHLQSDFSADSSKHHAITGNSAVQQRRAVRYGPTPSAVQQLLLQDSETLTNSQSQTQNISFSGRRSVICDVSPSQRPTPETASVIQQPLSSVYSADVYVMKEEYKGTKAKKSESSQIDSAELDVDSCCNNPPDQNLKKTFYPTVETDSDIEMNIGDRCKNGSSSIFPFCSQMSSNPLSSPPKPQSFSETIVSSQMVPYCYSESVDVSKTSHSAPHKPYLLIPNHSKTASSTHMSHTSFHSQDRLEWPVIKQKLKDDPDKLTEIKCKSLSATDVIPVQHTSHLHPASQFHMKTWDACHKSEQVDLTETVSSQVAARTEEKTTAPETVKLRHGIQTRQRPSAETNPLMLRRRVRSFISPIPAKRQNQEVPGQQSSTYSSSLSVDNFRKVFNNSESQPKVASLKMHHTISSTDSSTQAKTKTFPKKSRGLKLEAIVQKITPSMKKNDFSNSHMECDFSVVSNYISDRPDTEATAAFPQAEDDCLSFLGDSSLDELMPYRVSGKDPYSSECQGLESNTSVASSRALPKDFDFGLASAVSSGSLLGESKDDFSLLGPLPPQPPLLCPVQGSPPPSSSALSDIQQFTNTYQQLETRRSEQSAVNLLRQKLQDPGQGLDDYTGRDCYTGHSQSLILSRASQHHISSIRPTSLEPKTSEKLVPKGYFPSGKKKGRPVGSVNKQKRAQAQSASVNVFAAPQSSPTGSTVTPDFAQPPHMSTSPGPQPCPFSPSSSETFLLTVDQESEETLEMDREAAKLEQTKEKEIEENADSSRKQRGGGRDLSSKEELFNQTNSKGNMSLCGLLTDGRSNFFSPYVHVEKKVSEIGAVCTIVNGEEEKSKGNGKAGQCASDGPSNATLPTSLVRRERENEKTVDNWLCESTDSSVQSGMSLPTSRYVLAGPVVCEAGYTGQLLCCLCQKWANYKNLGDLYGPFYPADHAAKLPKNPPPMRQIPSLGGGFGMGYGMSAIAMESNALGFSSQECHTFKSYTDSDCMVSQATNPASPSTTSDTCFPGAVKAVEAFQLSRLVPHFWGQDDTVALGLGTSDIDKLGRVISSTVKQLLPEEVQIRPQHRKLTSHPRFKRRHKSSDEPRMVSINSKASLPFQPPPPSLDSLGPIAQLARLPLVPLDSKELWVHEACVVWTSGVYLVNGRLYGLQEALDGARETSCSHCELVGSTLGCYSKGCTLRYHYLCAIEADCALNEDNFSLRCPKHKSNRISKAVASNLEASERG